MRILQVARQFHPARGGVERLTMDLSHHLEARGHCSDVLTLNRLFDRPGRLVEREDIEGIHVTRIPYIGANRLFIAPGVLRHVGAYDVVHVHNIDFFSDYLILMKGHHRKPVVVSTHGGYFHTGRLELFKEIYFQTITKMLLKRADQVIADSRHDFEIFSPLAKKIQLIENGVDFSHFSGAKKQIETGLMLYIGRLADNKRIDNLIRCLAIVRQSIPAAHLAVVGGDFDGLTSQLRDLAGSLGVASAVTITGEVSDAELAGWVGRAHILVSASEYEAFGISVLEAMSTGTVPVVNGLSSFRDFIQDGQSGFLTDFSKPDQAASAIMDVLQAGEMVLSAIGLRAQESAARYDWEYTIGRFIDVYEKVLR